jgi:hypothetical protein
MTMMLAGGALVCAWVFLCLLSTERERSAHEAETVFQQAQAEAQKQAEIAGQREKLDVAAARH